MVKIDKKDRKILYELDLNCRRSNTQIGKKVGLKRDVVAYRINRMKDEGIINHFWTAINTFNLGYMVFRLYINFQYVNPGIREKIVQHFVNYKKVWAVMSVRAEIDFDVVIWVDDIYEFYRFWQKTLDKFEDYFSRYIISIYIESYDYKKSYILSEKKDNSTRMLYHTKGDGKSVKIDEVDYKLLNEMATNARIPLIKLAEKLDCSSQTVQYRLKNLKKLNVIQGFRVDINNSLFGLHNFKIDIFLRDHKQRLPIIKYLETKPYFEVLNVAIGWSDIEPELLVKNIDELLEIMEDINLKFPNAIKRQKYFITEKVHKIRWLPELEF